MIRKWRFENTTKKPASFFAFERSERQRTNDSKQSRNAKLLLFAVFLAGCTDYREPQTNCFNFVAPAPGEKDCNFEPLGGPLDGATEIE